MDIYNYLQRFQIKPSVQRMAIMEYLFKHRTHPNIDEIYVALQKEIPTLSKTTVYNTLKLFVECGAAQMLTIDERNACFDADTSAHAHFLCKCCGKIYDMPLVQDLSRHTSAVERGFDVEETQLYYRGTCAYCKTKKNENCGS